MEEIKSCPFCGSTASVESQFGKEWWVQCDDIMNCGSSEGGLCSTPDEAVQRWNRRAVPQANAEQDSLREIAAKLRRAGANLPAPNHKDAIFGATTNGLSIALLLVEDAIRAASNAASASHPTAISATGGSDD